MRNANCVTLVDRFVYFILVTTDFCDETLGLAPTYCFIRSAIC